jgi:hypothetical protein
MSELEKHFENVWLDTWFKLVLPHTTIINIICHKNMVMRHAEKYQEEFWYPFNIMQNPNITMNDLQKIKNKLNMHYWNWASLSTNIPIMEIITDYTTNNEFGQYWNWLYVSTNKTVTIGIVKKHLNFPWDWKGLSCNSSIKVQDVIDNRNFPWDWQHICFRATDAELLNNPFIADLNTIQYQFDTQHHEDNDHNPNFAEFHQINEIPLYPNIYNEDYLLDETFDEDKLFYIQQSTTSICIASIYEQTATISHTILSPTLAEIIFCDEYLTKSILTHVLYFL